MMEYYRKKRIIHIDTCILTKVHTTMTTDTKKKGVYGCVSFTYQIVIIKALHFEVSKINVS